jgi:predicted RNase H-like nuclease (RuvC/YqgF family)
MMREDEDPVAAAERPMDETIREMENERKELEHDIDSTRKELEELRRRQGAAGDPVAGDWRDTDDEAGGDDAKGAGRPE